MTNYAQQSEPPSPEQLRLLANLESERRVSFDPPTSCAEASRNIRSLLAMERVSAGEQHRELVDVREDLAAGGGCVALIHDDEIGGHGSTAHWR
jgi:hypothetical protein